METNDLLNQETETATDTIIESSAVLFERMRRKVLEGIEVTTDEYRIVLAGIRKDRTAAEVKPKTEKKVKKPIGPSESGMRELDLAGLKAMINKSS